MAREKLTKAQREDLLAIAEGRSFYTSAHPQAQAYVDRGLARWLPFWTICYQWIKLTALGRQALAEEQAK